MFCFPKQEKIFRFVSASKNLSVIVFPINKKHVVVFPSKIFGFVSASKNITVVIFPSKRKYFFPSKIARNTSNNIFTFGNKAKHFILLGKTKTHFRLLEKTITDIFFLETNQMIFLWLGKQKHISW